MADEQLTNVLAGPLLYPSVSLQFHDVCSLLLGVPSDPADDTPPSPGVWSKLSLLKLVTKISFVHGGLGTDATPFGPAKLESALVSHLAHGRVIPQPIVLCVNTAAIDQHIQSDALITDQFWQLTLLMLVANVIDSCGESKVVRGGGYAKFATPAPAIVAQLEGPPSLRHWPPHYYETVHEKDTLAICLCRYFTLLYNEDRDPGDFFVIDLSEISWGAVLENTIAEDKDIIGSDDAVEQMAALLDRAIVFMLSNIDARDLREDSAIAIYGLELGVLALRDRQMLGS